MSFRIIGYVLGIAIAFAAFVLETDRGAFVIAPETQKCTLAGLSVQVSEKGAPYVYGIRAKCRDGIHHLDSSTGLRTADITKLHFGMPITCSEAHKLGYWSKLRMPLSGTKICSA